MSDLRRYLARVVVDDGFRDLAERDVEASFEGFALSEAHKDALRARDTRVLTLLAEAIGYGSEARGDATQAAEDDGVAGLAEAAAAAAAPGSAPAESGKVSFVVQVLPQQVLGLDGSSQLAFSASIHAPQEAPQLKAPAFGLELTLQPQEVSTPSGPALAWGTAVSRWPRPTSSPAAAPAPAAGPAHTWTHRVDAAETKAAAAAVLAASPEDRLGKLLALAEALRG